MTFSAEVKEELSKINNLANKECVKAELLGYLHTNNISYKDKEMQFATESEYNINRFSKLLNNVNINSYKIEIVGKNFRISIPKKEQDNLRKIFDEYKLSDKENEEKAYVRGTFLGSGSINNPKNKYHIEIGMQNEKVAEEVVKLLAKYQINFKILYDNLKNNMEKENVEDYLNKEEKNPEKVNVENHMNKKENRALSGKCSIYSKDGEEISKFLAFIGASSSMLKFEEIRVYRDMRNNINRIVNCETANLAKTVDAAVKQINAINKLKKNGKFNELPDNLKELANLRLENPEASLEELGKMLKSPIGKSGVNYRMREIIKLSL